MEFKILELMAECRSVEDLSRKSDIKLIFSGAKPLLFYWSNLYSI